ncbi:MAG: hypothetical protein RIQ93_623 [Verrucomicrobiota bacterium]|jgi:putative membrane-bound dehydrogenase-like protein
MKRLLLLVLLAVHGAVLTSAAEPLRIFIRSGPKSHGPGAHDHPRFLADWIPLLNSRGAVATGGDTFPTADQLARTDVLVLHLQNGGNIAGADRANLESYLARGGGIVVIHAAAVSNDPDWYKSIIGGSWRQGATRWLEAPMHLYFTDRAHPITRAASNWQMDDEIYYDMDLSPEAHVLAAAYTPKAIDTGGKGNKEAQARAAEAVAKNKAVNIYDIQPQLWTYERTRPTAARPYRAFVSLPGHHYANFARPNYRAILLRGLAWAAQRANVDELCSPDELGDALRYPEGGPTSPAKAAAKIEIHPDFALSLVAAEPLINKVMNLDWDERGRLWVCETPEYPNGRRLPNTAPWKDSGSLHPFATERDPEDRISILTDRNGDGVMDTKSVFADKLELVTSFVLYRNGVIAATSPDIWYLEDTDHDGVCDRRTKLYTGLGINDTHAVINNLRWGLDGWIYATHGYSRGDVKSGDGSKNFGPDGSGVVRFKPDGSAFEQYSSRNGNTWGLEITWDGQVFWTQPTSGTVFFHTVLPESVLAKGRLPGVVSWHGLIKDQKTYPALSWPEQAYVQIDQVGRFTAAAGCAIYEGGAWPARWNYSYFTTEPTLNIVHHQFVRREGASYSVAKEKGREETEFMRSTDLWFRPIETRVGPDGALYVVDFYNQAVIHNDTRGPQHSPANAAVRPDRDHYFSRIWRVQHKAAAQLSVPTLDRADLASLVQTIQTSPNAHVKKLALRLAQENHAGSPQLAALARPMGSAPLARYEAARAATTPAQRAAVLAEFAAATDDWTKSALVAAATEHAVDFVVDALASAQVPALTPFVAALAPALPPASAPRVLAACETVPVAAQALQRVVLRALAELPGELPNLDERSALGLVGLIKSPATAAATLPLAEKWDRKQVLGPAISPVVRAWRDELTAAATAETRRVEIMETLFETSLRTEIVTLIARMLSDNRGSEPLRRQLIALLGNKPGADTSQELVTHFSATLFAPAFEQILRRPEAALGLLAQIRLGRITSGQLSPSQLARLRTHPDRTVARQAVALFDAQNPAAQEKGKLIASLTPAIERPANLANGKTLFAGACAACHRLGELGTRDVGPPLNGIGARSPAELLIHIVDPNREVEPSFWQWNIVTKTGTTIAGVLASENATTIVFRHQGGDTEVKIADIATRENTRRSLMPEGFEGLGADGLRDIIGYLRASASPDAAAATAADGRPKAGGKGDGPLLAATPVRWDSGKTRVLLIGGGSSHTFARFFGDTDSATLRAAGFSAHYTEDRDQAAEALETADVAVISVNRKFFDTPEYRRALIEFARRGKGIVMLHPGTWYGYADWPELNALIVGGGARGHDRLGKFQITVKQPNHPVMKNVPATFEVFDELYHVNAEPAKNSPGTAAIEVLAETSPSQKYNQPHPSIWITRHSQARIVGIAPGHDERVHDLEAFKTLLVNAVRWTAGK